MGEVTASRGAQTSTEASKTKALRKRRPFKGLLPIISPNAAVERLTKSAKRGRSHTSDYYAPDVTVTATAQASAAIPVDCTPISLQRTDYRP